ncbi:hypothetical protein Tco_1454238 [Tanacetum coccineum]
MSKGSLRYLSLSGPIHLVANKTVYKEWEDRMERAATTASSLEAETGEDGRPITTQPSTSKPQKKQSRQKQRKDIKVSQSSASTEPMTEKETNKEYVPKHSYDSSQSGEDIM